MILDRFPDQSELVHELAALNRLPDDPPWREWADEHARIVRALEEILQCRRELVEIADVIVEEDEPRAIYSALHRALEALPFTESRAQVGGGGACRDRPGRPARRRGGVPMGLRPEIREAAVAIVDRREPTAARRLAELAAERS